MCIIAVPTSEERRWIFDSLYSIIRENGIFCN